MVEPFLPGLIGEGAHLDMGELATFILALGTVAVEEGTVLWLDCEFWQGHEADASLWVRGIEALDVANIFSRLAILLHFVGVGDARRVLTGRGSAPVPGCPAGNVNCHDHLPHLCLIPHGCNLILLAFLGAGQVEGSFHNAFPTLGRRSETVAEGSDSKQAVAVEGRGYGRDIISFEGVDVALLDNCGELEADLGGVVGVAKMLCVSLLV